MNAKADKAARRAARKAAKGAGPLAARRGARKPRLRFDDSALPEMAGGWFDAHPRFEETSDVSSDLLRLNFRHRLIVERNRHLIEGARVLDVASHDGRFTLAALEAGAAHVTGIEARAPLVEAARSNLALYGADPAAYDFLVGDVFERIGDLAPGSIDTALVLGFLYHTPRQHELFAALDRLGVRNVVVDCKVLQGARRPVMLLRWEGTARNAQIHDPAGRREALSGIPSAGALELWMQEFGWRPEIVRPDVRIPASAGVYRRGRRVTITATR